MKKTIVLDAAQRRGYRFAELTVISEERKRPQIFLSSCFSDFISSGKAILWRSVVDAFAAGHDTWSRVGHLRWSIVIASIAGGVRVRLMCSGERCRAKTWSLRRANRARFRTRIGFVPL